MKVYGPLPTVYAEVGKAIRVREEYDVVLLLSSSKIRSCLAKHVTTLVLEPEFATYLSLQVAMQA